MPLCATMSGKTDDCRALTLTESAGRACHVVAIRSGANYYLAAGGRLAISYGAGREYNDNGAGLRVRKRVGVRQVIGGQINRKAVGVRAANCLNIGNGAMLVSVRKTFSPFVCLCELAKRACVNVLTKAGQIARLVMTPKLLTRKGRNLKAKIFPRKAASLRRYFFPVNC